MTDHRTIIAGRGSRKRAVRVEQARRRIAANDAAAAAASACRDLVHEAGVAAVADALGLAGMLDLGGVMTAERGRALDGRKQIRPKCQPIMPAVETKSASATTRTVDLSTARPLLAEISDLFRRSPERCPKPLYETRV